MQDTVVAALKRLIQADQATESPVVSALSLNFWDRVKQWVPHIHARQRPFTIAIGGGSGSGKSAVRDAMIQALNGHVPVSSFTQDNYYRDFSADFPDVTVEAFYDWVDFDDPAHIRFEQLADDLATLRRMPLGHAYPLPKLIYGTPTTKPTIVDGGHLLEVAPFIVTEGIHALTRESLCRQYDMAIYVDVHEDTRRQRWLDRNQKENRGTTDNMWQTTVRCMEQCIYPSRGVADWVLNNEVPFERVQALMSAIIEIVSAPGSFTADDAERVRSLNTSVA